MPDKFQRGIIWTVKHSPHLFQHLYAVFGLDRVKNGRFVGETCQFHRLFCAEPSEFHPDIFPGFFGICAVGIDQSRLDQEAVSGVDMVVRDVVFLVIGIEDTLA